MRILWTFCIYNEIELLPFKIDYIVKNNIDCYVFDNMSTDGTWEWLQENKVPSERFDSDNMFNLKLNIKLIAEKIYEVKPNWTIFAGCDIFYANKENKTLRQVIEEADSKSFNIINSAYRSLTFYYTGTEKSGIDPRLNYMFYIPGEIGHERCIAKFCPDFKIVADRFKFENMNTMKDPNFLFLHYHLRHDAKLRKTEQYVRRKKAWDLGLVPANWGSHYRKLVNEKIFVFNPKALADIRNSGMWKQIKNSVKRG